MGCCAAKQDPRNNNGDAAIQEDGLFGKRLAEIYRKYDKDNDGSLDRNQTRELLNTVLKEQGKTVSEQDLNDFIKAADANNDNKIQKKELYDLYKKLEKRNRGV